MVDTMEPTGTSSAEAELDRDIEDSIAAVLAGTESSRLAELQDLVAHRARLMRSRLLQRRAERGARRAAV